MLSDVQQNNSDEDSEVEVSGDNAASIKPVYILTLKIQAKIPKRISMMHRSTVSCASATMKT